MDLYPNPTNLYLGQKARIGGRSWEVRARMVLGMEEEGRTWYWDEFLLMDDRGDLLYLELDEGSWRIMQPFVPASPMTQAEAGAARVGRAVRIDDQTAQVSLVSLATVHFIEGTPPFETAVGKRARYFDAEAGQTLYAVEWDESGVEYFRGRNAQDHEVQRGFGLSIPAKRPGAMAFVRCNYGVDPVRRENTRLIGKKLVALALVLLGLSFAGCLASGSAASSGTVVHTGRMLSDEVFKAQTRLGPYALEPGVHQLRVGLTLLNRQVWVAGVVEAEDGTELIDVQEVLWHESGVDYSEGELTTYGNFIVRKAGSFYVRFHLQEDAAPLAEAPYTNPPVAQVPFAAEIQIKKDVTHDGYFTRYAVLALLASVGCGIAALVLHQTTG